MFGFVKCVFIDEVSGTTFIEIRLPEFFLIALIGLFGLVDDVSNSFGGAASRQITFVGKFTFDHL